MIDFNSVFNRRGTNSVKWDSDSQNRDLKPLWVADMDFKASPAILQAMQRRLDIGIFGYTFVPDSYYRATIDWFERRHNWRFCRDNIIYTSGVVPALSAIIKALTNPGDKIIIQTPVYNCFFSSIKNNGCHVMENPLKRVDGSYEIDFDHLEKCCSDEKATLMILCNPHNPVGRVWTIDELRQIDYICSRHNVIVVSDEIHCELVFNGNKYTPFATIATQPWVSCISPSKAFNIAGLQIANIIVSDDTLYKKIDKAININEVCDVNPFGVDALIAAYNESENWLKELLEYIWDNYLYLKEKVTEIIPDFFLADLQGTYLAWLDCRSTGMTSHQLEEYLKDTTGVWLNAGSMYGHDGEGYMRINLACPRKTLCEALDRILPALKNLSKTNF